MNFYSKCFIALMLMLGISSHALAEACSKECQKQLVERYFDQLSVVYRKDSKAKDIENLFKSLHPAVDYEHLNYQAKFNKEQWKNAFLNNLKRGAYQSDKADVIRVDQTIYGKGYVAASYSYGEINEKGNWLAKGDQGLLVVFKIEDGKIISVKEYW